MDLFGRTILFTLICLIDQRLVSGECYFDGQNRYLSMSVSEKSNEDVIRNYTSGDIESITDVDTHEYVELVYDKDEGRLDVIVIKSLTVYYMDLKNSASFTLDFVAICNDGSTTDHSAFITVDDVNDPPEFHPKDITCDVQYPWPLSVPVNCQEILVVDWDFEERYSSNIIFSTNESTKLRVEETKLWTGSTERPRNYSLKLYMSDQLLKPMELELAAKDGNLEPVTEKATIQVTRFKNYPPKFEKHVYQAEIRGIPIEDDPVDTGIIRVTDQDGNPLSVKPLAGTDLIRIEEDSISGSFKVLFNRELRKDDLQFFEQGVGTAIIDITAESEPDAPESTVAIVLFFTDVFVTPTTTESTTFTTITTGGTDTSCPPCTAVTTEVTSTVCPETSPTVCPETTTVIIETPSTNCPEITTVCPTTVEGDSSTSSTNPSTTVGDEISSSSTNPSTIVGGDSSPISSTNPSTTVGGELSSSSTNPPTTCPDITTICPETSSSTMITECTCEPCSSTEIASTTSSTPSTTGCPEQTTIYVVTPCPDTSSTENTPSTYQSSTFPVTDCPDVCSTTSESRPTTVPGTSTCSPCECDDTSTITSDTQSSTFPVTDCSDVCSTTSESHPTTVPGTSTCSPCECDDTSTITSDIQTSSFPVTDCPNVCTTTPLEDPTNCPPCTSTVSDPGECSPSSATECSCPEEDSHTGFIVGLAILSVLLVGSLAGAGYLWYLFRRRSSNPFGKLEPEPWIPEPATGKPSSFSVKTFPDEPIYNSIYSKVGSPQNLFSVQSDPPVALTSKPVNFDESIYNSVYSKADSPKTSFSVQSDPPVALASEPINFGSRGRASQPDLSQATNPLIQATQTPEPPIPQPDYPTKSNVVFDERVEVFTPAVQEYSDDDGGDTNETGDLDEGTSENKVVNDENDAGLKNGNEGDARL